MSLVGPYLVCPFNEAHRIIEGRLQKHLFKCRKNYPKNHKVVCPFDATHMLDPLEYEHHIHVCSTSGNVKYSTISLGEEPEVGIVPIEAACNLETGTLNEEDWTGNNPTYNPVVATEHKQIVRTAVGLSKAKKKQFRQRERARMNALVNSNTSNSKEVVPKQREFETPLRPPKKAAKALSCDQSRSVANNISISDLISKLKEVSIERNCDTFLDQNTTRDEEKENISKKEANTSTTRNNSGSSVLETKNTSKLYISQNDFPAQNRVPQNLNKEKEPEPRKVLRVSPRAANLCGEVKKISTGRGFTLAYQYLKAEISKKEGNDKSVEDFKTIYGYDENEEDIDSPNKSS